jgi:hypothetical protein
MILETCFNIDWFWIFKRIMIPKLEPKNKLIT